jgi:hypothetical protein
LQLGLALLALLGACEQETGPVPAAPPPVSEPRLWVRSDIEFTDTPDLPERWRPAEAKPGDRPEEAMLIHQDGELILWMDGRERVRSSRWTRLGPTLDRCLGDPMSHRHRPAYDPGAARVLWQEADQLWWQISFSGENPCRLGGSLRLPHDGEVPDTSALLVDGQPWSDGGPARALEHIRTWRRLLVRERWNELLAPERIELLEALSQDPDPEAAALLQAIIDRDPSAAADARRALERRPPPPAEGSP